jgi:hypothetical protein
MRWAPVAVASFALFAACRGSSEGGGAGDTTGAAGAVDGVLAQPAARGSGKTIGIIFTANVIGELEPCG